MNKETQELKKQQKGFAIMSKEKRIAVARSGGLAKSRIAKEKAQAAK